MTECNICPRRCRVDRHTAHGFCGEGNVVRLARAAAHYWEEPCISGTKGSGAVFFSGCNLKCLFCQNKAISRHGVGKEVSIDRLCDIFLRLQSEEVHNINLVTPSHFTPQIRDALIRAKDRGLELPVVWNSSGYESAYCIRSLAGLIDIYMPDFKYINGELAQRYSRAEDYFEVARAALDEMVLQRGGAVFEDGLMVRGVLVRHLALPGCTEDSKAVLRFLRRRYGDAIYISIMKQYTPPSGPMPDELDRALLDSEYDSLVEYAERIGIEQGFLQEGASISSSFIPEFDLSGV